MPQDMVLDDDVLNEILLEIEDQDDPKIMDGKSTSLYKHILSQ
jgi:hypothetical protein